MFKNFKKILLSVRVRSLDSVLVAACLHWVWQYTSKIIAR